MKTRVSKPEEHYINTEPYYQPIGEEIRVFDAAYKQQLPVLLKGPTGCGKTRFMEHMAWRLKRPLITVSCHDDLTASDLVGRFLITSDETIWVDGPLASAVRHGAICYLDEIVEARISNIEPQDYTRMGVFIRHVIRHFTEVEASTKLLITLSDGKPDDYDTYRGEYGVEDTRQALFEARRDGIHSFCITIDEEARDYLPQMYGAANYTVIDNVASLPIKVSEIYRRLTT